MEYKVCEKEKVPFGEVPDTILAVDSLSVSHVEVARESSPVVVVVTELKVACPKAV